MEDILTVNASYQHTLYEKADKSFCVYVYREHKTGKVFNAIGSSLSNQRNLVVELNGNWEYGKNGKKQFRVQYYDVPKQTSRDGIIAFLNSLKCGIGPKKAALIYAQFKEDTWDVLDKYPERLYEVSGIGKNTVSDLTDALKNNVTQRKVILLFNKANTSISAYQANAIVALFGKSAIEKLVENPFCICGTVDSITFEKCDAVSEYLGLSPNNPDRLKAYIFKLLYAGSISGHVCMPKESIIQGMTNNLACDPEECARAIQRACDEDIIKETAGYIYTRRHYSEEIGISESISAIMHTEFNPIENIEKIIDEYESETPGWKLAAQQREAIRKAFGSPFSIITGGPGTGKTSVIKAILAVHRKIYGESSEPVLLAPTGKAARRMTEATRYPASTIHSAVGYRSEEEPENPFQTIDGNLIIVDEVSMMDQCIANALLKKIPSDARLIMVGDPDQLPSVGCGNVLSDLIKSGVIPVTTLNVIYRQQGTNPIVENANRIHNGRTDLVYSRTFKFIECQPNDTFDAALSFFLRCVKAYGLDNVLLLNPQRNNTSVSVDEFNRVIQEQLNPARSGELEMAIGKKTYRAGDKVMQLKNTDKVKNGDTGYIREIRSRENPNEPGTRITEAMIEFNEDGILRNYNQTDMKDLDLAYCSTVHKSQGEEFDSVVMVVSSMHYAMLKRNLLYTGITRAKENVAIFGQTDALITSILDNNIQKRHTFLSERLKATV